LSCNTNVPDNPDTLPPTEYEPGGDVDVLHTTETLVTFADTIVPEPPDTLHV
jgi:hypothetical protein